MIRLQDALLTNANTLLSSALTLLDVGHVALARSLAILGLEESGKAIAVHDRRVAMTNAPDGEPFRCDRLDGLWASHEQKLATVHRFLVEERYWFGVETPDPDENTAYLGTINSWARRQDRSKLRGFYVDIGKSGDVKSPSDLGDEVAVRGVIAHVHQIGWQLRLGEHIEGKRQDEREAGVPPAREEDLAWLERALNRDGSKDAKTVLEQMKRGLAEGVPGEALANAGYRFNPPGADRSPFRNVGRPGYEAETRELNRLARELKGDAEV